MTFFGMVVCLIEPLVLSMMNFIFRCLTVDPSQQLLQSKEMFALAFQRDFISTSL